jgi:DNA-directed RNA polymerase subunit M/transcription elongation factor TFIIS
VSISISLFALGPSDSLDAHQLVYLTPSELASDDIKKIRDAQAKESSLAKRADIYQITRADILKDNGIDMNKGGEFRCRKCKGNKTTHYALQTRSSDEPMTVFVCCLGCGNRWRTT